MRNSIFESLNNSCHRALVKIRSRSEINKWQPMEAENVLHEHCGDRQGRERMLHGDKMGIFGKIVDDHQNDVKSS